MMKTTFAILLTFLFTGASPHQSIPKIDEKETYHFEEMVLRYNAGRNVLSKKDLKVDSLSIVAQSQIEAENANR